MEEMGVKNISQTFDEGTLGNCDDTEDDEERALYDLRRNGIPHHLLEEAQRRRENEQNGKCFNVSLKYSLICLEHQITENLSTHVDPLIVIRTMAKPDSGLQVKNRKWLKIPVPNSFIGNYLTCYHILLVLSGRELVEWLMNHITDLPDRKAARHYAAMLLDKKYIKHVVSKLTFTEKCYYVFCGNYLYS